MLIHGIVHLKGFDHERNMSAFRVMSCLEKAIQTELVKEFKKPKWCSTGEK
jgi:ssRNA-specific RNase YbeY (16S rRNA maturation enzyme)